jgi:hypothetical protein
MQRQAQDTAATFAQIQARQDEFQRQQLEFQRQQFEMRGSKQPSSSSILSSCDTSSLLGFLHHRLSLLRHYSQVDLRVRDSRAFNLPLPISRFLRPFSL